MRGWLAWVGAVLGVGCVGWAQPVPDFSLVDVNANSARYRDTVSPRDYRFEISAYYFGLAG